MNHESEYTIEHYIEDVRAAYQLYERYLDQHTSIVEIIVKVTNPLTDEELYKAKKESAARKNQFLGAAGKRLRRGVALRLLDKLDKQFDMTHTLAKRITEELLGRAVDRKILLERYGTTGRTAANKSTDFEQLKTIHNNPDFVAARDELADLLQQAAVIRLTIGKQMAGKGSKIYDMLSKSAIAGKITSKK